ncbi:MAG: nuclear transport factor 2 family protein [Candidatus Binatia bacterium]|nr:nuclear transport factor 2 family protein [Candidatus Binatia bacterium]
MRASQEIVVAFCEAWRERNIDRLLEFFHPDAVYHNMPLPPLQGLDAIRATLETFVGPAESIEFEILHLASKDNVVFTERIDRFRFLGKDVELPVAGVFEIENGKIRAWRDYFDMQTWLRQTAPDSTGNQ